jgi:hypothetical protein
MIRGKNQMKPALILLAVVLFVTTSRALAQEPESPKPIVEVSDLFFQAQGRLIESAAGKIDLPQWRVGFKSKFAAWVDAEASVGSTQLLWRPTWSQQPTDSVSLVDLKGTLHSMVGDLYVGQFRVPWGIWGTMDEEELWLPRTLLFERGYFPLRDTGAGFYTILDGFYMNLVAHNGEGAGIADRDNRMFVTGQWGFKGPANLDVGLGATTGYLAAPNSTTSTQLRGANAYFGFNIFGLGFQVEGSLLQSATETVQTDTLAWHADVQHPITEKIGFIGRYEQLNPDTRQNNSNVLGRAYAGGEYHSKDGISRLFLYYVKNYESQNEVPNDEVRVIWRIAPWTEK